MKIMKGANMISKNTIKTTADIGFDRETGRYYVLFDLYVHKIQQAFVVSAQCEDYDLIEDTMKNFTIEFLSYKDNNNVPFPYDKALFQEIELAAMEVFADLKAEEKTGQMIKVGDIYTKEGQTMTITDIEGRVFRSKLVEDYNSRELFGHPGKLYRKGTVWYNWAPSYVLSEWTKINNKKAHLPEWW